LQWTCESVNPINKCKWNDVDTEDEKGKGYPHSLHNSTLFKQLTLRLELGLASCMLHMFSCIAASTDGLASRRENARSCKDSQSHLV
jgi:hypothetical protein